MKRSFLTFIRAVRSNLVRSHKLTRPQLERARDWWHESEYCCPEAIAADIESVYPDTAQIHALCH